MAAIKFMAKGTSAGGHNCAVEVTLFKSANTTGTGSQQSIAHGLGKVPSLVVVYVAGSPASYSQCVITEGTHDASNCYVTCTTGWSYIVEAYG